MNATEIITSYNDEGKHEGYASREIDGREYRVVCIGLSSCGESFFDGDQCPWRETAEETDEEIHEQACYEAFEELRAAALDEVKAAWNYDGANWSEPVDEPEEAQLAKEPDDDHRWAVVRTRFHGGGVLGYATSEEAAEAWISWRLQGNSCTCGCCGIVAVGDLESLPGTETNNLNGYSPYALTA